MVSLAGHPAHFAARPKLELRTANAVLAGPTDPGAIGAVIFLGRGRAERRIGKKGGPGQSRSDLHTRLR